MNALNIYSSDRVESRISESVGYEMASMHLHDVYEIYMALTEPVSFFVSDRMYSLEKGDVMLFSNTDLHKVSVPRDQIYRRCVITFLPELLGRHIREGSQLLECFSDPGRRQLKPTEGERQQFLDLAEAIRREAETPDFSGAGQWLYLGELLMLLCRISRRAESVSFPREAEGSGCAGKVIGYIDSHFAQPISLETLGELCYLNPSYLCRRFRQETGFRIHDYLNYRRLSCAMNLLREGNSVSQAARMSGFGSDTFFIQVFRRNLNTTPYQYAKEHWR